MEEIPPEPKRGSAGDFLKKLGGAGLGIIAAILIMAILLAPVRMRLKDGGSVRYKSLVYEVTKIHQLAPEAEGVKPYIDGFDVKIFGMTVYRDTNE